MKSWPKVLGLSVAVGSLCHALHSGRRWPLLAVIALQFWLIVLGARLLAWAEEPRKEQQP